MWRASLAWSTRSRSSGTASSGLCRPGLQEVVARSVCTCKANSSSPLQLCAFPFNLEPAATRPSTTPTLLLFGKVIYRACFPPHRVRAAVTALRAAMSDFIQFVRVTVPISSWISAAFTGVRGQAHRLLPLVVPSRRHLCAVCGQLPSALPMVRERCCIGRIVLQVCASSRRLQLSRCDHVYCYGCAAQACGPFLVRLEPHWNSATFMLRHALCVTHRLQVYLQPMANTSCLVCGQLALPLRHSGDPNR
jgi:hypothetical protein